MTFIVSTNTDEIAGRLRALAGKMRDRTVPAKALAVQLYGDSTRNFDSGGQYFAQPWAPLKASTVREKARLGYTQPLVRTGALRAHFYWNYTNDYAAVGNSAPYASYHNEGTKFMAARQIIPPNAWAITAGIKVFDFYITQSAKSVGL